VLTIQVRLALALRRRSSRRTAYTAPVAPVTPTTTREGRAAS
jgi:hypothetical protein